VLADAKLGPRNASIFVEHALDGVRIARSGQRKGEEPRGLVRTQVVGRDHAGRLPIVGATLKPRPVHDWTSHAADAFRYLAMALDHAVIRKGFLRPLVYPQLGLV